MPRDTLLPLNYVTAVVGASVRWPNGHQETILAVELPHPPRRQGGRMVRSSGGIRLASGSYCGLPASLKVVAE